MSNQIPPLKGQNAPLQNPASRAGTHNLRLPETIPLDEASYPLPFPSISQIVIGALAILTVRFAWWAAVYLINYAHLELAGRVLIAEGYQPMRTPSEALWMAAKWLCVIGVLLLIIGSIAHFSTVIHIRLNLRGIVRAVYAAIIMQLGGAFLLYWVMTHTIRPILVLAGQTACGVIGLNLLAAGSRQFSRARQRMALDADQVLATDLRRPILYLRSFSQDDERSHDDPDEPLSTFRREDRAFLPGFWLNRRHVTFEEWLCKSLSRIGPVVAIGRPGEPLPALGAARKYVSDAHWKAEVLRLYELTRFTCLVLGSSPGLDWEFQALRAKGVPQRLLLIVPQNSIVQSAWSEGLTLDTLGIVFASDWRPILITGRPTAKNYRKLAEMMARHAAIPNAQSNSADQVVLPARPGAKSPEAAAPSPSFDDRFEGRKRSEG